MKTLCTVLSPEPPIHLVIIPLSYEQDFEERFRDRIDNPILADIGTAISDMPAKLSRIRHERSFGEHEYLLRYLTTMFWNESLQKLRCVL